MKKLPQAQTTDLQHYLDLAKKGKVGFKTYATEDANKPYNPCNGLTGIALEKCCAENPEACGNIDPNAPKIYYFHPDHLGTSTFLTDINGAAYQFFLNLPFGETMAEQKNIFQNFATPYKFTGKELDEETGLYYFGARYYDPKNSIWLGVDPLAEKYPGWSPYVYCADNPINAIDPDGRVVIFINGQHSGDGGNQSYWNGLDQRIANRFGDYNARYYDGAIGGWKNTTGTAWIAPITGGLSLLGSNLFSGNRRRAGKSQGYDSAYAIYSNLAEGETIKIATHSMGGAYGKGFVKGLKKWAKEHGIDPRIERVLDLATYQGSSLEADNSIPLNEQIAHTNDGVAGVSRINGVSDANFNETRQNSDTGGVAEHSVDSFTQQELNKNVKAGSPSTAQPAPADKKIKVQYQQNH